MLSCKQLLFHMTWKGSPDLLSTLNGGKVNPVQIAKIIIITVEPRLSGLFLWSQFCPEYLLVMIKIHSHILFKTTALKSEVKASLFRFQKAKIKQRSHTL